MPAICGTNWVFSVECEASRMDLATAISFGSLAEITLKRLGKSTDYDLRSGWSLSRADITR